MPLVVFNFNSSIDGSIKDFRHEELTIPSYTTNSKWTLRSVNVVKYSEDKAALSYVELSLPELMKKETVLFQTGGDMAQDRKDVFRFYVQHHTLNSFSDSVNERSVFDVISLYPNWDLGVHNFDRDSISCELRAYDDKGVETEISNYSIILSAE